MATDWKQKYGISPVEEVVNEPSIEGANLEVPKADWKTKYGITPTTAITPKVTIEKAPKEKFTIAGAKPKYILSELGKQLKETSLMDWTKGLGTAIYGAEQTFIPTKIINALDHHFHITEKLDKLSPLVKTGVELTFPAVFGVMRGQREMEKGGAKEILEAHPVAKEFSGLAGDLANMILANAILPNPAQAIKSGILKNASDPIKQFFMTTRGGATVLRILSQSPRAMEMFGGLNFLKETADQIDKGEFSPTKLISQTLKGTGWGLMATIPTALPTYPLRITGGVVAGTVWSTFETLIKNKQITSKDIPAIASNAILMGAFQALTGKGLTGAYEQIYLDDTGHYLDSKMYGEETANLLGRLNYQAIIHKGTPLGDLYASARDKVAVEVGIHQDQDFIIEDGKIKILSPFTNRVEPGKEYLSGIKNALEMKEGFQINPQGSPEARAMPIGVERGLSEILTSEEKLLIQHLSETGGKVPIMDLKLLEPNPQTQEAQIKYPDFITRLDLQLGYSTPSGIKMPVQDFPTSLATPAEYIATEIARKFIGQERLRQSPKGAELLKKQLTKEEEEARKKIQQGIKVEKITKGIEDDTTLRKQMANDGYGLWSAFPTKEVAITEGIKKFGADFRLINHISTKETGNVSTFEVYAKGIQDQFTKGVKLVIPKELEEIAKGARDFESARLWQQALANTPDAYQKEVSDLLIKHGFIEAPPPGYISKITLPDMKTFYNLAVKEVKPEVKPTPEIEREEWKPTMIKFENKKAATLFYNEALKAGKKPVQYGPTKEQPFHKVVIYEKVKPEVKPTPTFLATLGKEKTRVLSEDEAIQEAITEFEKLGYDKKLLQTMNAATIEKILTQKIPVKVEGEFETKLEKVSYSEKEITAIKKIAEIAPNETFQPETDEEYQAGFEAEGRDEVKFDNKRQVFHSTESEIETPNPETRLRVSALKEPRNQLGYVLNLIRAGKVVPEDVRWVIDNYIEETQQQIGETIAKDLGNGKYKLIFSDEALTKEALDELYPPDIYKEIKDYHQLQENYGIDTGDFAENDVVRISTEEGQRWGRLINIYDDGRAIVETSNGEKEVDFWSLKKPSHLTKAQEQISQGIFPKETMEQKFELTPDFMKEKGIEIPKEIKPEVAKKVSRISKKNINNKIFDIIKVFTGQNNTLPILANIGIDGNKVMATDLETGIIYKTDKVIGKIALDAKALKGKTIDDIKIIDDKKHIAQIGNLTIEGISLEDYPLMPEVKQSPQLTVSSNDLVNGLNKSIYALGKDTSSHVEITGIFIKNENKQLRMVASDGFRLSQIYLPSNITQDFEAIIPSNAAKQLLKTLKAVNFGEISIAINSKEHTMKFVFGNFTVITRTIQGEFPDYKPIIPKKFQYQFVVDRERLLSVLSQVPESKLNEVTIDLDQKNKQIILSKETVPSKFKDTISVVFQTPAEINPNEELYILMPMEIEEDKKGRISFNVSFLKDFLTQANYETVQFGINEGKVGTVLKENGTLTTDMVKENTIRYKTISLKESKKNPLVRKSNVRLKLKNIGFFYTKGFHIQSANDVADIFSELKNESREKGFLLNLTKDNRVINIGLISVGSINAALVSPIEIIKSAITVKAEKVYFVHNHPSGDPEPSADDIDIFIRLHQTLAPLGIDMEAVIINYDKFYYWTRELGKGTGLIHHTPLIHQKTKIPVFEMKQIVKDVDSYTNPNYSIDSPKKVADIFSTITDTKTPTIALLALSSRNRVNGYTILGASLKDIESIKVKIGDAIAKYNPASFIIATNLQQDDIAEAVQMEIVPYLKISGVELTDIVGVHEKGSSYSFAESNMLHSPSAKVAEDVANYGDYTDDEKAVIKAIQSGEKIPIELSGAIKSLQEKGVIQTSRAKAEKPVKVKAEKPTVKDLRPGERISQREITLSKSRVATKNPYMVSYKTGTKRVVKTFDNIEDARRRFDMMVELRNRGAMERGILPKELQARQEQKAEAHIIAQKKHITPSQYRRLALAYTGVNSMKKMTPEQADEFINNLKLLKPKFGGKISIPRSKEIVTAEIAERKFKDISFGWLLNIFKSPAYVFRRIGIEAETKPIFEGFQLMRDFINHNFTELNKWQKELGVSEHAVFFRKRVFAAQSRKLFIAANTGNIEGLTEKEISIVERARTLADQVADLVDDARAEIGLEPMNRRENYITNLLTEESHFLIQQTKQAPNELYAMLDMRLPASVFNRLLLERKGGLPIKEDFWQALKAMVRIHGKYIHLNPPVHRLERFMRFYGDKIPQLSRVYIRGRINRFLGRPSAVDVFLRKVDEVTTNALMKIPGLSKKVEIEFQNGLTEVIETPRIVSKLAQKSLSTLKALRYTYDLAFSVSFYAVNLTQFWINTVPKLRGNLFEIYGSAIGGYAQMLMDFFRPSKWEYWRQRGVLTEIDNVLDQEYRVRLGGDVLNIFAKLSEFNNRVGAALSTERNLRLLQKHGKFGQLYKELANSFGDEAKNYARNLSDLTQFRYGMEEKPVVFDNPIMNLYYQYNTFALKQIELVEGMLKNSELRTTIRDFKKAVGNGKTKEFVANLTQGQRGEFMRFIINVFILSLILGWSYIWQAVFKGMVPNQVEGAWKILKGLWTGNAKMRAEGAKEFLLPPSATLITNLSDYGIKATIMNSKVMKELDLLRIIITGEGTLKTMAGKPKEKITRGIAIKRLFGSSREKTALINQKGWDLYNNISDDYTNTREKAIKLIAKGQTKEARQLAHDYNIRAKKNIKKLRELRPTDLRLKDALKSINKSKIVSQDDFDRWKKSAKENY